MIMTVERNGSTYPIELVLDYLVSMHGDGSTWYALEIDREPLMKVDGRLATAIRFCSENRMPPIGFERVRDVFLNDRTYRCYISWGGNQTPVS